MRMRFAMLVEGAVSDAKKKLLQGRYKLTDEQLQAVEAVEADDSFFEWLCRCVSKGLLNLPEDTERIKDQLDTFSRLRNSPKFKAEHPTDILKYTPDKLFEVLDTGADLQSGKETKRKTKDGDQEGAQLLYNQDSWKVFKVTTAEAAVILGSGSNWCTTQPQTAQNYLDRGPLFIFQYKSHPYAQLHPKTKQFMDRRDRSLRDGSTLRDSATFQILDKVEDLDPELKEFANTLLPLVHPSEKFINMVRNRPARVLHELLGKIQIERYPAFEPRIFEVDAPVDIAQAYFNGFQERDPEVEKLIANKPNWAAAYAIYVIKGEWPAAEEAIKKSKLSGDYLKAKGAGTEKSDHKLNFKEFVQLLKAGGVQKRFPEFEPQMVTAVKGGRLQESVILDYCRKFKFWWPEVIPFLSESYQVALSKTFKQPLSPDTIWNILKGRNISPKTLIEYFQEVPEAKMSPEDFNARLEALQESEKDTESWKKSKYSKIRENATRIFGQGYMPEPKDMSELLNLISMDPSLASPEKYQGLVTAESLQKVATIADILKLMKHGFLSAKNVIDTLLDRSSKNKPVTSTWGMWIEDQYKLELNTLVEAAKKLKPEQVLSLAAHIDVFIPLVSKQDWTVQIWQEVLDSRNQTLDRDITSEKVLLELQPADNKNEDVHQWWHGAKMGVIALLNYMGPHLSEATVKALNDNDYFKNDLNPFNRYISVDRLKSYLRILTNYPEITTLAGKKSKDLIKQCTIALAKKSEA